MKLLDIDISLILQHETLVMEALIVQDRSTHHYPSVSQ